MSQEKLEAAIQDELAMIEAIKRSSTRLSAPLLGRLLKTLAAPLIVFIAFGGVSSFIRSFLDETFPDGFLSVSVYMALLLFAIWLIWRVWRWSSARFGGGTLMARLRDVTMAVYMAEKAITAARARPAPDADDIAEINRLTRQAWNTYAEAMRAYGYEVE
jgi:hypothetical protein